MTVLLLYIFTTLFSYKLSERSNNLLTRYCKAENREFKMFTGLSRGFEYFIVFYSERMLSWHLCFVRLKCEQLSSKAAAVGISASGVLRADSRRMRCNSIALEGMLAVHTHKEE